MQASLENVIEPSALVGLVAKAAKLEAELNKLPQVVVPVCHCINGGIYTRTGVIEAGTTFVGATHKKDHINVVIGDVTVATDNGPVRYTGHHVFPVKAGAKRVAYTHAQTVWTTIIRTDLQDVRAIEAECVESAETLQTQNVKGIESCLS